jgi:hypothetical protein
MNSVDLSLTSVEKSVYKYMKSRYGDPIGIFIKETISGMKVRQPVWKNLRNEIEKS